MSARALVTILQRFEHVKYLRYLMGQLGAALAEIFFPWPRAAYLKALQFIR